MKKFIFVFCLLSGIAMAQSFGGQSTTTVRVVPPYKFCLGQDNGKDVCMFQTGANTATATGVWSFPQSSFGGGSAFAGGTGVSFQDVTEIASPGNPVAGVDRLYTDSTTHFLTCLRSDGSNCFAAGGGSGTVTTASVVTANGVSATVANPTTTPAFTFTLGAITPTSTNGVSAATMAFLDATSSVQTQLNAKGAGTVTSASVFTANGVSGSVANPTTTPAITLTLGAITPSSVTSSGAIVATTGGVTATAGGLNATSDGVHNGLISLAANTTDITGLSGTGSAGFLGPNIAPGSLTNYFCRLPATAPSGGQVLSCGTPSSNVSAGTWVTPAGAPAFSAVTAGTNTAALLCGTGCSLGATGTGTITATAAPFSGLSASNNATAGNSTTASSGMVVSALATLSPSGTGQIAGSQDWYQNGPGVISPPIPTLAVNATGGTLTNASQNFFKLTYVGLSVTEPSGEVKTIFSGLTGCTGGNQCSITITMPTSCTAGNLPAGVTGCTVWSSSTTQTEKQQTASAACVNITTTTCVVGTLGVGSSLTTPQTGITPAGAQTVTCPNNIIPTNWAQKSDGNFYNLAGIDISAMNLPVPIGRFTFCDGINVNDTSGPPSIQNALVSIHHVFGKSGGTTLTGSSFIDPALGVEGIDDPTANPLASEQSLVIYGERIISNNNITCGPLGSETCAGFLRGVVADNRTAGYPALAVTTQIAGLTGQAFVNIPSGGGNPYGSCATCMVGVQGNFSTTTAANLNNNFFAGVNSSIANNGAATLGHVFAYTVGPLSNRFLENGALFVPSTFSNAADWSIRSDATAKSKFQGTFYLGASNTIQSNAGLMTITGSTNQLGSISTAQMSTPATFAVAPTLGSATTWAYKVVFKDGNGGTTAASTATQTTVGAATLDGTHFNTISPAAASVVQGVVTVDVYRTTAGGTPSTLGKIGSINVAAGCPDNISTSSNCGSLSLVDNGLAGDGTTAPTVNTTGGIKLAGPLVAQSLSAPVLTGTGACATITTQKGGSLAGQFTCTGSTGASTITITQQTPAPNGWRCAATDITAAVNIPQSATISATVCTLTAATVTANDIVTFDAIAY